MRSRQLQSAAPAVLPNNADELELGASVGSRAGVEAIHGQREGQVELTSYKCVSEKR